MWTRKDYGILAAAALATFGLTVGTFWPRLANAVDGQPAATTDVKTPTLTVGSVQVTAQLAKDTEHTVILTIKNTSDETAAATFKATAQVTPPISPFSRSVRFPLPAWTNDYTLNLKPGETQTLTIALPDAAFNVPPTPAQNENTPKELRTVAGKSELVLTDLTPPKGTASNNLNTSNIQVSNVTTSNITVSNTTVSNITVSNNLRFNGSGANSIIALQLVAPPAPPAPPAPADAKSAAPVQVTNAMLKVSQVAQDLPNPQASR